MVLPKLQATAASTRNVRVASVDRALIFQVLWRRKAEVSTLTKHYIGGPGQRDQREILTRWRKQEGVSTARPKNRTMTVFGCEFRRRGVIGMRFAIVWLRSDLSPEITANRVLTVAGQNRTESVMA